MLPFERILSRVQGKSIRDGLEYEDPIGTPDQTGAEVLHFYTSPLHTLQPAQAFPSALESWQCYNPCAVIYQPDWMLPAYFAYASIELEKTVFAYTRYSQPPPALERYRKLVGKFEPLDATISSAYTQRHEHNTH